MVIMRQNLHELPDVVRLAATWTFDTITQPGTVTEGAPGTVSASYTFTAAGVYRVKLTVTDACGNAGTAGSTG